MQRVKAALDDYADAWRAMRTASCQATARGAQSAQLLDLRTACLDRRRIELRALTDVFVREPDSEVVDHAVAAVADLPPLATCADAAALRAWELLDPPPPLTADPYAEPAPAISDDAVCAVLREPGGARQYRLRDFPTQAAAVAAGAVPTHFGVCGRCSPLADLAVYMETNDLTAPVRACGLAYPDGPMADHVQCLRDLGFTEPCAQIWYFNTVHTRAACLAPCFAALDQPYHLPDGSLNACLQCDEVQSGPVFKAIAGRTRRNTGLPNAMCRPCSEVRPLIHTY